MDRLCCQQKMLLLHALFWNKYTQKYYDIGVLDGYKRGGDHKGKICNYVKYDDKKILCVVRYIYFMKSKYKPKM